MPVAAGGVLVAFVSGRLLVVVVRVRRRGKCVIACHDDEAEDDLGHDVEHGVGAHLKGHRERGKSLREEPHHLEPHHPAPRIVRLNGADAGEV